jgi:hypothetical protein
LCVIPIKKLVILLMFLWTNSFADNLADEIKKQTDSLRTHNIDTIIVHRYSLFNGRYNISYEDKELQCDNEPTVAHIFWARNKQWYCLRLDNCGLFELIEINAIKFAKFKLDPKFEFKKESAHFTLYRLTIISDDKEKKLSKSGTQKTKEKGYTVKTFKTINKIIKGLEDNHRFKRAE